MKIPRRRLWAVLVLVLLLTCMGLYATLIEPAALRHRAITLTFRDLPTQADGLVIAHTSDLHMRQLGGRERKLLRVVDEDPPDILVITGDLVSAERHRETCLDFLSRLEAKIGIWAVQGNWEHYTSWTGHVLREDLEGANIRLLVNDAEGLPFNGTWMAGTDDPSLGEDDASRTLAGTEDGFVVLLAHSPVIMDEIAGSVDLILSGHTHGGQVSLPLIGAPWGRYVGGGYLRGLYEQNGTIMYVTRGVGMTHLPVRFMCAPEIVYITLRSGDP